MTHGGLPRAWLSEFLEQRQLNDPDGRALYAYRCRSEEFNTLRECLRSIPAVDAGNDWPIRAFALYAAEWWQRQFDGSRWSWEPILASINWQSIHYPELYEPVRQAWAYWRTKPVRLPTSGTRYLGTFACNGGLPLALVGASGGHVTAYLKAVLQHVSTYREFVDDTIELAQDQQHLLRPPTLRRDFVFRLAAEIADAILDLRADASGKDPLGTLDKRRPDWRKDMPLDLGNERARQLLAALLQDAKRGTSATNAFRVERYLRRTSGGWRLGARAQLPSRLAPDMLARQVGVAPGDLPPRLEIRLQDGRTLGILADRGENGYVLAGQSHTRPVEVWDNRAADELRLEFLFGGGSVGQPLEPRLGAALSELPWVFREDDADCPLVGEGSTRNRSSALLVLLPNDCSVEGGASPWDDAVVLERQLWRITRDAVINTSSGRCIIRPATAQLSEEQYSFLGQRYYDVEASYPLFRGRPSLLCRRGDQAPKRVKIEEVSWRQPGGDWLNQPDAWGQWTARHIRDRELRHVARVGILPDLFSVSTAPGGDITTGCFMIAGADKARVSVSGMDAQTDVFQENTRRVTLVAKESPNPPATVQLRILWPGGTEILLRAPFPGSGGRFLATDRSIPPRLSADELYGVRAFAFSSRDSAWYLVEGELKAHDLGNLARVAYFRHQLRKTDNRHELALIELLSDIQLLLQASASEDARIVLRILDDSQRPEATLEICRFAAALENNKTGLVFPEPPLEGAIDDISFQSWPLARPAEEPVALTPPVMVGESVGVRVPGDLSLEHEPWIVVMRRGNSVCARPLVLGGQPDPSSDDTFALNHAALLADKEERMRQFDRQLRRMANPHRVAIDELEEDWNFLTESLLRAEAEAVPIAEIDLLRAMTRVPRLLVRCLFRVEEAPRQLLWRIERELPFSWLLIPREIWMEEAKLAAYRIQSHWPLKEQAQEEALKFVDRVLDTGTDEIGALAAMATDVRMQLLGFGLQQSFIDTLADVRRNAALNKIRRHANDSDWPIGWGRDQWQEELGQLPEWIWLSDEKLKKRRPMHDTPDLAAWCSISSISLSPRATFVIKRNRAHDAAWFDSAYGAAWAKLAYLVDRMGRQQ